MNRFTFPNECQHIFFIIAFCETDRHFVVVRLFEWSYTMFVQYVETVNCWSELQEADSRDEPLEIKLFQADEKYESEVMQVQFKKEKLSQ